MVRFGEGECQWCAATAALRNHICGPCLSPVSGPRKITLSVVIKKLFRKLLEVDFPVAIDKKSKCKACVHVCMCAFQTAAMAVFDRSDRT